MNTKLTRSWIRLTMQAGLAVTAALFFGGCTTVTAPSKRPDATVNIEEWSAAYYGSAVSGKGTLNYRGVKRRFGITGLGAGGMGGQKVTATGKVYNLNRIEDFAGTYSGVRRGLTLIQGKMHAKLTNKKGVELYLVGKTKGLASSFGRQAFQVTWKY